MWHERKRGRRETYIFGLGLIPNPYPLQRWGETSCEQITRIPTVMFRTDGDDIRHALIFLICTKHSRNECWYNVADLTFEKHVNYFQERFSENELAWLTMHIGATEDFITIIIQRAGASAQDFRDREEGAGEGCTHWPKTYKFIGKVLQATLRIWQ